MSVTESPFFLPVTFLLFLIASMVFSWLINGLLLKFSASLGNRQIQQRRSVRWSNNVKPSVGGFSFYILFIMSLAIYGIIHFPGQEYLNKQLLGMVAAVTCGFLIGLADDAYNTIPLLKFFSQLFCGLALVFAGVIIPATGITWVDVLLTLTWVVGLMNSVNMLDNMDGISGSVSLGIIICCLLVLTLEHHFISFYTLMLLATAGALSGFLYFNWHPSRLYMGDTGSQFLGVFLAAISIPVLWKYHAATGPAFQWRQYLIPLYAFQVPLIDTTTVFVRRILRGQSPFVGGRDHITHHFAYAGLSDGQVSLLLGAWSLLGGITAAWMAANLNSLTTTVMIVLYVAVLLIFTTVQYFYEVGLQKEKARTASGKTNTPELQSPAAQSATA